MRTDSEQVNEIVYSLHDLVDNMPMMTISGWSSRNEIYAVTSRERKKQWL